MAGPAPTGEQVVDEATPPAQGDSDDQDADGDTENNRDNGNGNEGSGDQDGQLENLPEEYQQEGSETTDLSQVDDLSSVENFTLDIPGKNKVVFNEPVDLSADDIFDRINDGVNIDETGKVEIDSELLPELNKPASITMSGIDLESPEIIKDREEEANVSNLNYDRDSQILTFDVEGFSTYEAVEDAEAAIEEARQEAEEDNNGIAWWLWMLLGCLVLIIILIVALLLIRKPKKDKEEVEVKEEKKEEKKQKKDEKKQEKKEKK